VHWIDELSTSHGKEKKKPVLVDVDDEKELVAVSE
jgi:hypothetical protein